MKFQPWRQLRLAGCLTVILAMFLKNVQVCCLGLSFLIVGTINGLHYLEDRVTALEKEKKDETTEA